MKKVQLNVETLRVESFEAEARDGGRGTVGAHSVYTVRYHSQCDETCDDCPTVYSCNMPWLCA